jgi:signal transduction histidine kinase
MASFIWILSLLVIAAGAFVFVFLQQKNSKNLKVALAQKEQEYKHQSYENLLLDLIHQRYGYLIDTHRVLDTILDSLSSVTGYTAVAYLLMSPKKMKFRFHMHEQVSAEYLEVVKTRLISRTLADSNFQVQLHLEETVSGNLLNENAYSKPNSFVDIPLIINEKTEGFITVSSQHVNFYNSYDTGLVKKSINKVLAEVGRLKNLIDTEKTKLEVLVDKMDSGVLLIDEDFTIVAINSTCIELLELKSKQDTTIFEIVGCFDPKLELDQALAATLKAEKHKEFKNVQFGSKFLDINIIPIKSSITKKSLGIVINDKTSEKAFEEVKNDFVSMMVHELRSPLTIIKGASDMILKKSDVLSGDQQKTLLTQIKDSSTDLLGLVNDLLDSAKIEAGKISIIKKSGDINRVLAQVVTEFRPLALEKKLGLTLDTDMKIAEFNFDAERIAHVLTNLLSNALKFTTEGGVHVYSKSLNNYVEIGVVDTGIGIKKEAKKDLFNKYAQLQETSATKEKGTGLGLVITKGIVEAHGGKIYVEDNFPKGSIFKFTLPIGSLEGETLSKLA